MDKIWLKSYPKGVPAELPTPAYKSVRDMIDFSLREFAGRPAYTNMGTTLTFADLDRLSMQFAGYLQKELRLLKGERVAIMLPNVLQYPVALCGIFRAGLVVVNVNPLYTARELKHQLVDSGAKCIIILENFAHILESVVADTQVQQVVTTGVGDLLKWPKGAFVNFALRHLKKAVPKYKLPGSVTLAAALTAGSRHALDKVELGYGDIAFLQYTGGTTGLSKGAMLSHRNMVFNVHQGKAWQGAAFSDLNQIVAITALPLYHIFSLQSNCLVDHAAGRSEHTDHQPARHAGIRQGTGKAPLQLFHRCEHPVCGPAQHAGICRSRFQLIAPDDRRRNGCSGGCIEALEAGDRPAHHPGLRAHRDLAFGRRRADRYRGIRRLDRPADFVDRGSHL